MSEIAGFIVIHRKILNWEWYTDSNTKALFLHCLIKANYEDKIWRGIEIKRGSFVTSLENLSAETGLTVSQVRTSLDHLLSTGELKKDTNNRFTLITVNNYEIYQDRQNNDTGMQNRTRNRKQIASETANKSHAKSQSNRTRNRKPVANESQTNNKQIATTNNINNKNNKTSGDLCPTGTKSPHGNNGNNASVPDIAPGGESVLTRQPVEPLTFKEWLDYCYIRNADKGEIPNKWFELHHGADLTEKQVVRIREIIRDGH